MDFKIPPKSSNSVPGTGLSQELEYLVSSTSLESITINRVPFFTARLTGIPTTLCCSVKLELNTKIHSDFSKSQIGLVAAAYPSALSNPIVNSGRTLVDWSILLVPIATRPNF